MRFEVEFLRLKDLFLSDLRFRNGELAVKIADAILTAFIEWYLE